MEFIDCHRGASFIIIRSHCNRMWGVASLGLPFNTLFILDSPFLVSEKKLKNVLVYNR